MQRGLVRSLKAIFGVQSADAQDLDMIRAVQPVWNVEPLIAGRGDYLWTEATQLVAAGGTSTLTLSVPSNEEWHLKLVAANTDTAAVGIPTPHIQIRPVTTALPANTGYSLSTTERSAASGYLAPYGAGERFDVPFVLGPGEKIIVVWQNTDAAGRNIWLTALRRIVTLS